MNRRSFLKLSGTAGGGLLLRGFWTSTAQGQELEQEISGADPWFFSRFAADGTVRLALAKQEMGQSSPSGLAMLFADEVGISWKHMKVSQIDYSEETKAFYATTFGGTTGGSWTIHQLWNPMRIAGASLREMLVNAAAKKWGASSLTCATEDGHVIHKDSNRRIPFFDIAESAAKERIPNSPRLKDKSEYKLIGKPLPNARNRELVTASLPYGINKTLPGMVHAAIKRCPVYGGKLIAFDDSAARMVPGVIDVFAIEGQFFENDRLHYTTNAGVAVLATSTWAAFRGKAAISATWDEGRNASVNIDTLRRRAIDGEFVDSGFTNNFGNAEEGLDKAAKTHEAVYETNLQPHACLEPLNATAAINGDHVDIWTSTQNPGQNVVAISKLLSIPEANIRIHTLPAGGSFGRRAWFDFIIEAVLVAKQAGKPVKLTWTREDDMQHDYYHPYERSHWKGGLDSNNQLTVYSKDYAIAGPNHPAHRFWVIHWAFMPYGAEHQRAFGGVLEKPAAIGSWRSVSEHLEAFSEECFVDEMAHLASRDPYEFRLEHCRRFAQSREGNEDWFISIKRARDLLESVPEFVDWHAPLPKNHGRGIAISRFGPTVVLQIAEVEVSDGDYHVTKIDAIVDAGFIVNPQLAENQIEGSIIWALSALRYGKITLENGRIKEGNFNEFSILRNHQTPEMNVHFLDTDWPIGGIGEPGVPAVAPAVLNAIFAASGKRLRTLPIDRSELA